jgi:hypothetical protein
MSAYTHTHTHTRTHIHTYTHTYTSAHTHSRAHTHTHTMFVPTVHICYRDGALARFLPMELIQYVSRLMSTIVNTTQTEIPLPRLFHLREFYIPLRCPRVVLSRQDCTLPWWWGLLVSVKPCAMSAGVITPGRTNQSETVTVEFCVSHCSSFMCILPCNYFSTVLPSVFIVAKWPVCVDATLWTVFTISSIFLRV